MPFTVRPTSFRNNRSHNSNVGATANVTTTVIDIAAGPANPPYCGRIYYGVALVMVGGGSGLVVYGSRGEKVISEQGGIVLECFGAIIIALAFVMACIGYQSSQASKRAMLEQRKTEEAKSKRNKPYVEETSVCPPTKY